MIKSRLSCILQRNPATPHFKKLIKLIAEVFHRHYVSLKYNEYKFQYFFIPICLAGQAHKRDSSVPAAANIEIPTFYQNYESEHRTQNIEHRIPDFLLKLRKRSHFQRLIYHFLFLHRWQCEFLKKQKQKNKNTGREGCTDGSVNF